ncbi:dihydroxyacetone kinase, C-terminal domain [Actinomyces ruminicola]|uniref:Dihydroxyacetone kinase, C-terminal domain n=1 Tax=Actinomyces ruminicola TaxID=332524 RepID=A0A1H0BHG3_9ACTO|nr:dihydroxyacetone kinase subunit L [Actinomyces ruminicola]SDN45005.1 dihydroxyacetone kinase, C-terminal domain [Actinomyces ruminicola]
MLDRESLAAIAEQISALMAANRDYLVSLDQVNGDGDLGISMDDGFRALAEYLAAQEQTDLGQLLRGAAKAFNGAAPSSLGTILSFGMMGMARSLRGRTEADAVAAAQALQAGVDAIMGKAESKPGEKTILDALVPGVTALAEGAGAVVRGEFPLGELLARAAEAAARGSEATREMEAVHGRAAYSASRSIGVLDGGSVVGRLIFEALAAWAA